AVASRALPTDFALVAISDCLALRKCSRAQVETQKGRDEPLPVYRSFPTHLEIPAALSVQPVAQSQALSRTMRYGRNIGSGSRGVNGATAGFRVQQFRNTADMNVSAARFG